MTESTTLAELKTSAVARQQETRVVSMSFFDAEGFALMQRIANAFTQSDMVPKQYQGNLPNCMIALDMAQRIGANPLMVMQNLYIVHGNPGWSSKFLIATVNTCGRYSTMRYEWCGTKGQDDYGCRGWAIEKETGERLNGIWVTWKMVKAEGWSSKSGSKWLTMEDQMFIYRAAAFWQRAYAPDLGMGLITEEELRDTYDAKRGDDGQFTVNLEDLREAEAVDKATGEITPAPKESKKDRIAREKAEALAEQAAQIESEEEHQSDEESEPDPEMTPSRRDFGNIE